MNLRPMILVSAAVISLMLLVSTWAYVTLPADAQVPIHWGVDGQPDDFADKPLGLLLLPGIALLVTLLLAVIPRVEPRRANLERSSKAYGATWIGVMLLLGGLHLLAVAVTMGATLDVTRILMGGTGILFAVIGNYLPKVRPNYLMGIRTPWTLTSDLAWDRTHRMGGRLFVAAGPILLGAAIVGLPGAWMAGLLIGLVVVMPVALFAYSYAVWRDDPDRRTT